MTSKLLPVFLLFTFLLQNINSQNLDMKMSPDISDSGNADKRWILFAGQSGDYYVIVSRQGNFDPKLSLEIYNQKLLDPFNMNLDLTGENKNYSIEHVSSSGGLLNILAEGYGEGESSRMVLFTVNLKTHDISNKKLFKEDDRLIMIGQSENLKFTAIMLWSQSGSLNSAVYIYDENFARIYDSEFPPYTVPYSTIHKVFVSNAGQPFIVVRNYKDKVAIADDVTGFNQTLIAFTKEGEFLSQLRLVVDSNDINEVSLNMDATGLISGIGFYLNNHKKEAGYLGVSFFTYEPDAKEFKISATSFPEEVIKKKNLQTDKPYRYPHLSNLELSKLEIMENGELCVLAEEVWLFQGRSDIPFSSFDDLFIVKGSPLSGLSWMQFLPKNFDSGVRTKYQSYNYTLSGNKIYILFNADPDYFTASSDKKHPEVKSEYKSIVALAELNESGVIRTKEFLNAGSPVLKVRVAKIQPVENKILMYLENFQEHRLGIASF